MKTAPPGWRPGAGTGPDAGVGVGVGTGTGTGTGTDQEALIKEARRRQHRRYLAVGVAIMVMLAAAAGIAVAVTGPGAHPPSHQGPRRLPASQGQGPSSSAGSERSAMAPFFADVVTTGEGNGSLQVRASANGRLVTQDEQVAGVYGLAATGAGRFVIAVQVGGPCATRLDRVQLSGQGRPGGLSPVGPELRGQVWSLTAGSGGAIIGFAVSGCSKGDPGYIGTFDTRTGRSRQWSDVSLGGVSPGQVAISGALSMSANGRFLAFAGWDMAADGSYTSQVVRVLPVSAAAGTVAERSRVVLSKPVSGPELTAASLSPSGALLYLCSQSGNRTARITDVAEYRTSTGQRLADLASLRGGPAPMSSSMALDRSGRFLLVPYSLKPSDLPVLQVAAINITGRTVTTLTAQLPGTARMGEETGMNPAW